MYVRDSRIVLLLYKENNFLNDYIITELTPVIKFNFFSNNN